MNNKKEIQDRIKLLIRYSLEKTLTENKKSILEQGSPKGSIYSRIGDTGNPWETIPAYESKKKKDEEEYIKNFKARGGKIGCDRPDKLIIPGVNKMGLKGEDAMVEEYPCTYAAPIPCELTTPGEYTRAINGTGISTLYLPPNARVFFWDDITQWTKYFEQFWEGVSEENEERVIDYFLKIVPLGTVREFSIAKPENPGNVLTYRGVLTRGENCGHYDATKNNFVFRWYYTTSEPDENGKYTMSPYPEMQFVDNRSDWDYFLDEYGFVTQMVLGAVYALTGIFCEGCTWPLIFEIGMEGALGVAQSQRDIEKGDNISASLDLIFAVLPMMKTQKFFGAVPAQEGLEVLNNMRKAGLSRTTKPTDVIRWYRKQPDQVKKTFSKMIQGGDEWSEARVKEFFEKAGNDFFTYIRQHPKKLMDIPWYKTIHAKEAGIGAALFPVNMILRATLGQQLNSEEMDRLSRVHANIKAVDEKLALEFEQNLIVNATRAKEYLKSPAMIEMSLMDPSITGDPKLWQNKSMEAFGESNYQQIPEDETGLIQNQSMDKKSAKDKIKNNNLYTKEEVIKNGWLEKVGNIEIINGIKYYVVKDTTSTPKTSQEPSKQ